MIGRAHHLQDDRLFECYLAGLDGTAVDRLVAAHLAECAACAAHLRELVNFMNGLREEAVERLPLVGALNALRQDTNQGGNHADHASQG